MKKGIKETKEDLLKKIEELTAIIDEAQAWPKEPTLDDEINAKELAIAEVEREATEKIGEMASKWTEEVRITVEKVMAKTGRPYKLSGLVKSGPPPVSVSVKANELPEFPQMLSEEVMFGSLKEALKFIGERAGDRNLYQFADYRSFANWGREYLKDGFRKGRHVKLER